MEAILNRRSIRKYTADPVSKDDIRDLLKAAMSAPSAGNEQPWHFIVVDKREILDQIPNFHPFSLMLRSSPVAIVVCGDLDLETREGYWVQDCSAAVQNILIAAQYKGLGSVWLGVYPKQDRVAGLQNLFGLPESVIPLAILPIGYPAENKPPSNRYNESRVRFNHW